MRNTLSLSFSLFFSRFLALYLLITAFRIWFHFLSSSFNPLLSSSHHSLFHHFLLLSFLSFHFFPSLLQFYSFSPSHGTYSDAVMDALKLSSIPDKCFDFIMDKGLLDAQLCTPHNIDNATNLVKEMYRVLSPGDSYLCCHSFFCLPIYLSLFCLFRRCSMLCPLIPITHTTTQKCGLTN